MTEIAIQSSAPGRGLWSWAWLWKSAAIATICLTLFAAWSMIGFGSLRFGVAYLRGDRLLVDTNAKSFGTVRKGENPTVTLRVFNATGGPLKLIGARVSCSCLGPNGLPLTIPDGQSTELKLKVYTSKRMGELQETILW